MSSTRTFHLGDILSITTGCLVSPHHMEGVHHILDWMTGNTLLTHQLGRAAETCGPDLLRQHPDLAGVTPPDTFTGKDHVEAWLAAQVARFGEWRDVAPLAAGAYESMNPLVELAGMMRPDGQIIAVVVPDAPSAGSHPQEATR